MPDAAVPEPRTPAPHEPVLVPEVLRLLGPCLDGQIVDATVGTGGHAEALLRTAPGARVLALDRDPDAVEFARRRLAPWGDRVRVRQANFRNLADVLAAEGLADVSAVLMDLGASGLQLKDARRGFSFRAAGPLDMRMGPDAPRSAAELLRSLREGELADLIFRYGEDRFARRIARRVAAASERGDLRTTEDLARVVAGAVPRTGHERIHPATRTFQALRIAVNGELDALDAALPQALDVLRVGGRLAVISFHSLEDRAVKRFLAREARDCVCPPEIPVCRCGHVRQVAILTRRPVEPSDAEVARTPSARSAKLRAAERLGAVR